MSTQSTPSGAVPGLRRIAAGAALVVAIGLVAGCGDEDGTAGPSASPSATVSESPSPSASPSASPTQESVATRVYYLVDTRSGLRLSRELHDLPGDDPAKEAVEAMIAGPDDPDYSSPWNPDTEVLGVTREAEAITVDLSDDALTANIGSEGAALMIQQLVYTVTEAVDEEATVSLLVEGAAPGDLWGVVRWDEPVGREDPLDVRALVQIDTPREGATSPSPLTVEGDAAAFEANVPWRVLDESGAEVESGFTMTSEGMTFAPYSFTVELDPGTYTVEISEDDPSGGEGGTPTKDTRTVTVE